MAFDVVIIEETLADVDAHHVARLIKNNPAIWSTALILCGDHPETKKTNTNDIDLFNNYLMHPIKQSHLKRSLMAVLETSKNKLHTASISRSVSNSHGKSLNILLAEDNVINQQVTSIILKKMGCLVDIAENGRLALTLWQNNSYDLILMDWHMPIMDGLEATRLIRAEEFGKGHTLIIALTANAMDDQQQQIIAAGMDDHLTKPFKAQELSNLLIKHFPDRLNT